MIYDKSKSPALADELFREPTSEFRGTPFWAWNCRLDKNELLRQIGVMQEMGFGGYHIHVRSGMDTEYLSEEFMALVRACADEGDRRRMLTWLYDEDRWPSGFAGGFVTRDKQYRIRYLLFTPVPYAENLGGGLHSSEQNVGRRTGNGTLLGRFAVALDADGCLASYRTLRDGEGAAAGETEWFAYIESPLENPRYNGYTYVNTLSKAAIERFIETTHEKYKAELGERFGKSVPAIFTDEPQHTFKTCLNTPFDRTDLVMPWSDDLEETYRAAYPGETLTDRIPELFWELPGKKVSLIRYHWHDHVAARFADAFAGTLGKWCDESGIALTGHLMREPTLASQSAAVGEVMRSYPSFGIPGIDMLADRQELTTAKQAQSSAHQCGKPGVMSELYGVTGWDFDFRGHKLQGDWQAALGVTVRVPHLAWVTMLGEAKRDYPASINYQSPWYKEYSYVENHFARVNTAMTRGKPLVRVGVIHPIESYWINFGPSSQTALERDQLDTDFANITSWLLWGNVDFDFICESTLPDLCPAGGAPLRVGQMAYDTVIVPACDTIRRTTYERLLAFERAGGKLIFMGKAPALIDAVPSDLPAALAAEAGGITASSRAAILDRVAADRDVEIRTSNGSLASNLLYQAREDGANRWYFIVNGQHPTNIDINRPQKLRFRFPGLWRVKLYNTLDGGISALPYTHEAGSTVISRTLNAEDSLLLLLEPDEADYVAPAAAPTDKKPVPVPVEAPFTVPYTLDEPNVLILDQAKFARDDDEFSAKTEELLRIDTDFRRALGWTPWGGSANQPWCIAEAPITHRIRLRFTIESDTEICGAHLALETPGDAKITFNGAPVDNRADGYYVDYAIGTVPMPPIPAGVSELELEYPFGERTAVEWCYLLGDFDVKLYGRTAKLTARDDRLGFRSITEQGKPFYSGALTYHLDVETHGGDLEITLPQYRAALCRVTVDGDASTSRPVAFAPYRVKFRALSAGKHRVDVKVYVNRTNGFTTLHNADGKLAYQSPATWRSSGDVWTYEWRVLPEGLLSSPILTEIL